MTKPTVLVFRSRFLPVSETFISDHVTGLKGWRAVVAYCEEIDGAAARTGLPCHRVSDGWRRDVSEGLARVGMASGLDRFIEQTRPQLIHAHFLHDGMRMVRAAHRHNLPLIVTAHGNDATLTRRARLRTRSGRRFLRGLSGLKAGVSSVVCVSDFIREDLIEQGWSPERLVTIPLGIDLARIQPDLGEAGRDGVLYVGRLVEKKGGRHLIRALSLLPEVLRDTPLTMIGDGPLRRELEDLADDLRVRIEFLGAQPRAVGLERMARAAVLALPSIRAPDGDAEGLPVVVMEAQARACPVVMFDVGSARAALSDGVSGLLARDGDEQDLALTLARILNDPALAQRLGRAGPGIARERFDRVINMARLEAHYDRTLALKDRPND